MASKRSGRECENGRVRSGDWENERVGERESGRVRSGEWESGRVREWDGRMGV